MFIKWWALKYQHAEEEEFEGGTWKSFQETEYLTTSSSTSALSTFSSISVFCSDSSDSYKSAVKIWDEMEMSDFLINN